MAHGKQKEEEMTLLEETKTAIKESGHAIKDIVFIGSEKTGHQCSWDQFKTLATVEYDSGYGSAEVATDLIIVFSDGSRMWRGEYDGAEWWEFSRPFKRPKEAHKINRLIGDCWDTLEDLHDKH